MDGKKYLSEIRLLRSRAKLRRWQAVKVSKSISILKENHGSSESVRHLNRILTKALQLADQYEAESRNRAACIGRLPEPARSIERLCWVDGLSFREIADQLGYSLSYVYQVHSKTIRKIGGDEG